MNYRHHFHAGNFADVAKHVLMIGLLRALQQKPKGMLYLDTHAGRGAYDLARAAVGDSLERTPEWPDGVGRLWSRADLPPLVREYVERVRTFDRARGNLDAQPRYYPGSPWIARLVAREQDRLALCEKHPAELAALQSEMLAPHGGATVFVREGDGYGALRALLPPPERRALVLIDPPYEAQDEFLQAATSLGEGLSRFPTGVYALWYPLTWRARVDEFIAELRQLPLPPTLLLELAIAGERSDRKLKGCGLVILNPPWRFEATAQPELDYLADVLAQERGGGVRADWIVPEK